jgi:hypothetical protein
MTATRWALMELMMVFLLELLRKEEVFEVLDFRLKARLNRFFGIGGFRCRKGRRCSFEPILLERNVLIAFYLVFNVF